MVFVSLFFRGSLSCCCTHSAQPLFQEAVPLFSAGTDGRLISIYSDTLARADISSPKGYEPHVNA